MQRKWKYGIGIYIIKKGSLTRTLVLFFNRTINKAGVLNSSLFSIKHKNNPEYAPMLKLNFYLFFSFTVKPRGRAADNESVTADLLSFYESKSDFSLCEQHSGNI